MTSMSKRLAERRRAAQYKKEIYSLAKSFRFAFRGFCFAIDSERNMRIHLSVACFVMQFSFIYGLSSIEYVLLLLIFGLVISAEMINTVVEVLVDLETSSYHALARVAKDVAAGAVLVLAIMAMIIGIILFGDFNRLQECFWHCVEHPILFLLLAVEIIAAILFIFFWNHCKTTWKGITKK